MALINKITQFPPGVAVAYRADVQKSPSGKVEDTLIRFEPWPVEYFSMTAGMCEEDRSLEMPLASDDGKKFFVIVGLDVNGHKADVMTLRGKPPEYIQEYFEGLMD